MGFIKHNLRLMMAVSVLSVISLSSAKAALTVGDTYTISIEKVTSTGGVTNGSDSLGVSTTAAADADGNLAFTLTGIPDNTSCNFLVIDVANAGVSERKSVVPCPNAGESLPLGASEMTTKQANALLTGFSSFGADDSVLAVFLYTAMRTTKMTDAEGTTLINDVLIPAIQVSTADSFYHYLATTRSITNAQLIAYRKAIIELLANTTTGYSKLVKDSVDSAGGDINSAEALAGRGKASAELLRVLIKAATEAGFPQEYVLEAFESMGEVAVPALETAASAGTLSESIVSSIMSGIGGGISKLRAEKDLEKYTKALETLGAAASDITQFTNAVTTLSTAMDSAFSTFEAVFTGSETKAEIEAAQNIQDTAMHAAFDQFEVGIAVSDAKIATMITNIETALGEDTGLTKDEFQQYQQDGSTVNWSVMMVVLTDFASSTRLAGGDIAYTRDDTAVPSLISWLGRCSGHATPDEPSDQTLCESSSGTWTEGRGSFSEIPTPWSSLFQIQEDLMILDFTRFGDLDGDGARRDIEKEYANTINGLSANISGTSDGTTALTSAIKAAMVTLMQSPEF
jgi:hypothetical protein